MITKNRLVQKFTQINAFYEIYARIFTYLIILIELFYVLFFAVAMIMKRPRVEQNIKPGGSANRDHYSASSKHQKM
jgi:hypothetical protein